MKKHRFFDIFCHGEQQSFCHCGPRAAIGFRTKPGMTIKTTLWRTKPAMTKVLVLLSLIITIPAFATDPDPAAQKTVASKAYVDTKQDKIPAGTYGANNSVVTYDSTTGDVQERWILGAGTVEESANDTDPFRAVLQRYNENTRHLSTGYNGTLDDEDMTEVSTEIAENSLVPARYIAAALFTKQTKIQPKWTSTTYSTQMAPKGGQTIDLTNTSGVVGTRYIAASGNEPLTLKSGADNTILYVNGTKTVEQFQTSNFGGTGDTATTNQNYIKNALVSLELLKDVYSELDSKITNNALPTGTTGTVVTYNGTNATTGVQEFTETAMTGTVTYTNGVLNNANNIATITAVGTRQKKKECGGYEPAAAGQPAHDGTHPGDEDYCWLWIFPDD